MLTRITVALVAALASALPHVPLDEPLHVPLPMPGANDVGITPSYRFIYFAVLEGLYEDGVANDVVDSLTKTDASGMPELFVWSCPLCMPAFSAFKEYRERRMLDGFKSRADTFGPGLSEVVREAALAPYKSDRFETLGKLVERYIERRMKLLRFTEHELSEWRYQFEELRKQGMANARPEFLDEFKRCAVCDAANEACE